jgi:ABC-type phosphate/phosphonate transport system substrate-binding protein
MTHRIVAIVAWLIVVGFGVVGAQDPEVIQLGVLDSLVKDLSPARQKFVETEFPDMVKEFTEFKSKIYQGGDPFTAAKKLEAGEWHFAVFQGVEFAWAQAKYPKLKPLMVAITGPQPLHAALVVSKKAGIKGFEGLKGKDAHLLLEKEHCRLFADKGAGGNAKAYFDKLLPTTNSEAALDAILFGKVDAVIADNGALEAYKEIQPGRFRQLDVVVKSEPFPATVVVYHAGSVSDKVVTKFREGMFKANKSPKGQDAMANFRITAFEKVPADYSKQLIDIAKAYPPPTK